MSCLWRSIIVFVWCLVTKNNLAITTGIRSSSILDITFDKFSNGLDKYTISVGKVAWLHAVPPGIAIKNASITKGTDMLGHYTSYACTYKMNASIEDATILWNAEIRMYDTLSAARWIQTWPNGANGVNASFNFSSATLAPVVSWPAFDFGGALNQLRWFTWAGGQLGYESGHGIDGSKVGSRIFHGQTGNTPSPLFLVDEETNATLVVSPFDHFTSSLCHEIHMSQSTIAKKWGCGIANTVKALPKEFSSSIILFAGLDVSATMDSWGKSMRQAYGTSRKSDVQTTHVGYYTDNGAIYNQKVNLDAAAEKINGTALDLFGKIFDGFKVAGLPLAYIQLDDWWYYSGNDCGAHPGEFIMCNSSAKTSLFPTGLAGLHERITVPLNVYAVEFAKDNPTFVNANATPVRSVWPSPAGGWIPSPETALRFYRQLFTTWKKAGMSIYEIDFMVFLDYQTPIFYSSPEGATPWLTGMATAAAELNITIQYCSATVFDIMEALRFDVVTNIRASTDYACYINYKIGPGFLISWALGLPPSKDVLWTTEVQPNLWEQRTCGFFNHSNAELDIVLAIFSMGPVGIGDGIGFTNMTRARACCRADGRILQPDKPLTPLDFTLWLDRVEKFGTIIFSECMHSSTSNLSSLQNPKCEPLLLQSHTTLRVRLNKTNTVAQFHHLLAVAVRHFPVDLGSLYPSLPGDPSKYIFLRRSTLAHHCVEGTDAFTSGCVHRTNCNTSKGDICMPDLYTDFGFADGNLPARLGWSLYMLVPTNLAGSGWILLGELDKYNPISSQRIDLVRANENSSTMIVMVLGAPNEKVELWAINDMGVLHVERATINAQGKSTISFGK